MRRYIYLAALAILAGTSLQPAIAAEGEMSHAERGFHRNYLAILMGATTSDGETGFTAGLDYEFRPLDYLGFGIMAEYIAGNFRDGVVVLPVFSHPNRDAEGGWQLVIGPGLEIRDGKNDFLVRLGISHGFPVDGWILAPEFNGDLVHGEWHWVYGVSIGRNF